MNEQQRVQAEADAVRVAERIKTDLLAVAEQHLLAMGDTPRFARYAALEGARAMFGTLLRHVLAEDEDQATARAICACAVASLDTIVTPTHLH